MRDLEPVRRFDPAPWPLVLKVVSALATGLLIGIAVVAARTSQVLGGVPSQAALAVALLFAAILTGSALFSVTGYTISPTELGVRRLLWTTVIPLTQVVRTWSDPAACKRSLRLFGNGGLFAFTGWYSNSRLGRYRLFATDVRCAVVLELPDRKIVITPASPDAFLETALQLWPSAAAR